MRNCDIEKQLTVKPENSTSTVLLTTDKIFQH